MEGIVVFLRGRPGQLMSQKVIVVKNTPEAIAMEFSLIRGYNANGQVTV